MNFRNTNVNSKSRLSVMAARPLKLLRQLKSIVSSVSSFVAFLVVFVIASILFAKDTKYLRM